MPCAIVLFVDGPFEDVDSHIGLTSGAEARMSSANPVDDIIVLVIRGFERIPASARDRLAELKYRIVDAESILAEIKSRYEFANEARIWRGDRFHEACFLRWLVLEVFFGSGPVLAMDADIVWRVDPYYFFDRWSKGGSVLCFSSPCFAFIKDHGWYEAYRSGLQRLAAYPHFGEEYGKDHFRGLYHDQALIQYLVQRGDLANDVASLTDGGISEQYFMISNPLNIKPAKGAPKLTFEQTPGCDRIGGRVVPFWHMQTRFARYLWAVRFITILTGQKNLRVPYEPRGSSERSAGATLLDYLHMHIQRDEVRFHNPKHGRIARYATRAGLYADFFGGDLARDAFREDVWWRPGVWAQ